MPYESSIEFTLDTICPWTYLARRRLARALAELPPDGPVTFTIVYKPYQLYPDASAAGEDKYAWYKSSRYGDNDEKMKMYTTLMSAYGTGEGINFKFGGTIAGTLNAHRVVQWVQEKYGPDPTEKLVESLYKQYFEQERHPSSTETLSTAMREAGVSESEAKTLVEDEYEGLADVKSQIQEQASNGIDAVPHIVIEGKKRDITLVGCKEVTEYAKALSTIIRDGA